MSTMNSKLFSKLEQGKGLLGRGYSIKERFLSVVSTAVCDLESQSQTSWSSSQDNVSVSGQSNRVLSDL